PDRKMEPLKGEHQAQEVQLVAAETRPPAPVQRSRSQCDEPSARYCLPVSSGEDDLRKRVEENQRATSIHQRYPGSGASVDDPVTTFSPHRQQFPVSPPLSLAS